MTSEVFNTSKQMFSSHKHIQQNGNNTDMKELWQN